MTTAAARSAAANRPAAKPLAESLAVGDRGLLRCSGQCTQLCEMMDQTLNGISDLGFGVFAGDEEPQPRRRFIDRRVEDRLHVHDLHATILHLLGFDHEKLTPLAEAVKAAARA